MGFLVAQMVNDSPVASLRVPLHQNSNVASSVGYFNPVDLMRTVLSNDIIDICCPGLELAVNELKWGVKTPLSVTMST